MIHPNAIVIFSAGVMPLPGGDWRTTTYDDSDAFGTLGGRDRVEAVAILAKQYPASYIVNASPDMEIYTDELRSLGVESERIISVKVQNNTLGQMHEALRLAVERRWSNLIFISSGFHLPRLRAFFEATKSAIQVEFIASESVLAVADHSFEARFKAVQATPAYRLRLESEARGLEAIKRGDYKPASNQDKKEK